MNSEAALTETWIVGIFNPGATIIRSTSCYEFDSRYTKHYQQFWRYHNHISGLMPLTNSYLTTILVHMLWYSGELHILAPLALLLVLGTDGAALHVSGFVIYFRCFGGHWDGMYIRDASGNPYPTCMFTLCFMCFNCIFSHFIFYVTVFYLQMLISRKRLQ